ncbi:hypothetical protein Prede_2357 [Prevotella dentalis DSM 3688]|uniref:Replication-associated protein G2P N-terminal domain-containing protein n=1 Tax=Prevotella dentalis (strain ATCC 49559 / DSM 3688 / JCM 13448 / NCTC 12043 / ES 2772) TaxID=908937 RepID=F9D6I5_PREDD|nr:phage/plasmid replication protein [Prevotella dentalis]AGB29621.1 hypothetical protein Prede_2357 [Prevotella dentalis DSM 3688]EGQ11902.1 hypothetical protein HMPREF9136_2463 [Prevotella dentalis DSM 3688]
MYDKVKLWIDSAMVGEQYPTIANYLEEANTQINHQTGEVKTFGSLEGLKVSIFVGGLSVVGSLPKYLYGSNVYPLDRHTTAQAIAKLSDALHLRADEASVTGIEFGTNFLMMHQVPDYLAKLGNMPRLSRYHFEPSTLYYKGTGRQQPKVFAFYDKMADARAKGMECPEGMKEANLLRYEMRLNGRLSHQLGVPEVQASTLYDNDFYRMMVKRYQDSYFSISKQNQIKTNVMSEIKTVSDAFNVFVARLINQTGQTQIVGFLDELKEAGVFDDRKNYTRLKNKIQDVATKANITISDELIRELDDEIRNCGAYV